MKKYKEIITNTQLETKESLMKINKLKKTLKQSKDIIEQL